MKNKNKNENQVIIAFGMDIVLVGFGIYFFIDYNFFVPRSVYARLNVCVGDSYMYGCKIFCNYRRYFMIIPAA